MSDKKCKTCKDTGYYRCVCQLDGFNEWFCEDCHNDTGYMLCTDCNAMISIAWNSEKKDKRIAELEAEVARLEGVIQNTEIDWNKNTNSRFKIEPQGDGTLASALKSIADTYNTTKCDNCQKKMSFDDANFVQQSDGTVRYECATCYNS